MRGKATIIAVIAVTTLAACGGSKITDRSLLARLAQIRAATSKYKDVNAAINDGYLPTPKCVTDPGGSGALGRPYVNGQLSVTPAINLLTPEQLLYEPESNGPPQLVGVAYTLADTGQRAPDIGLGRMDGPFPGAVKGQPSHFELVAWLYRRNPKGIFDMFNENVHCP
jgi:hypothetical protein